MSTKIDGDGTLLDRIQEFYRNYYHDDIGALAQKYPADQQGLEIDWMDVYRFDMDIADDLRNHPGDMLDTFAEALEQYDLPAGVSLEGVDVYVGPMPETQQYGVGQTRANQLESYVGLSGQVAKRSDVRPKLLQAVFECQRCGGFTTVRQQNRDFQEPHECQGCERQGPFRINYDRSELTDFQLVQLQQPPEEATGAQGATREVTLEGGMVNAVEAGDRVTVSGVVKAEPGEDDSPTLDTYLEGYHCDPEEVDFHEIDVDEYEAEIYDLADNDPIEQLVDSLAPNLRGMQDIKEALTLQLFGGVASDLPDGGQLRGDFHVLLLGDPGCGKSTLLRAVETIAPRSTYASGKGASAAGMTGAAVRDDFGNTEWSIEAGALSIANNGIACVDEIDKIDDGARSSLHGALESQKVEIDKAGIDATLPAKTALLAAGNPKYGRFDQFEPIGDQIDLGPTLLSRFDLMFMLSDSPDRDEDREVAKHMVESRRMATEYTHGQANDDDLDLIAPSVDRELMRAYIAYAKQNIHPTIPEGQESRIIDWYTELRQANGDSEDSPVPVTARKVEAIERLAEASARARLSPVVENEDIERAGRLVMKSMRDVGVDPATQELDADVIETGTSKSQRDRIKNLKLMLSELTDEYSDTGVPHEVLIDEALSNDMGKNQTEHDIEKLKDRGEIYEPLDDHYRLTD